MNIERLLSSLGTIYKKKIEGVGDYTHNAIFSVYTSLAVKEGKIFWVKEWWGAKEDMERKPEKFTLIMSPETYSKYYEKGKEWAI